MIIAYSPEGEKARRWDLSEIKIMAPEAEAVERLTDLTWTEALAKLSKGSMLALRAVAFVLEKRDQPALRYSAFVPAADELDFWLDATERAELREQFRTSDKISDEERDGYLMALDVIDEEIAKKDADPQPAEADGVPKDSAPGASPTSG